MCCTMHVKAHLSWVDEAGKNLSTSEMRVSSIHIIIARRIGYVRTSCIPLRDMLVNAISVSEAGRSTSHGRREEVMKSHLD